MPLNSSPLAPASSAGVHMESRWISPTGWNPPMAQMFPPNTTKFWPVTSDASSEARKATSWAMLRGSHSSKPSAALAISPKRFSVMRVRARGEIEFTVMPYRSSSRASTQVSEAMPALADE